MYEAAVVHSIRPPFPQALILSRSTTRPNHGRRSNELIQMQMHLVLTTLTSNSRTELGSRLSVESLAVCETAIVSTSVVDFLVFS